MIKSRLFTLITLISFSVTPAISEDQLHTTGPYTPDWESLSAWECPEWFKNAKFGIWAHWGPQCEAEDGDWYARFMYYPGSGQYNSHLSHYGSPAKFGLKDLCNEWKAENWNPTELVELYKSVGARYFMVLANHHDNFDLWDSPYQEWNSVNIGPRRDIVGEWSEACRAAGLPLGVSVHASHAWTWLEPSQKFDGNLTLEDGYTPNPDGSEKWWKGYDPQELYAQNHPHSTGWENSGSIHSQWEWGNGADIPSEAYKQKMMNRTLQLIYDYNPDMIYFDDTVLPFYGCDEDWGRQLLASYYNFSAARNDGDVQVVVTGKQLDNNIKRAMLWDVERGIPDRMQDSYWQTCTCIGDWHYNRATYNNSSYKSGATVIRMLVDIVSKNGNLLLNIPVKGDGTIDEKERAVLDDIKKWMDVNSSSIYDTRTWKTFGEGPLAEADNPMNAQGFNEGLSYTSSDVRFVQKNSTVYATIMAWPDAGTFTIKAFSPVSPYYSGNVTEVELLGHGKVEYSLDAAGLHITIPESHADNIAPVFAITTDGSSVTPSFRLEAMIGLVNDFLKNIEGHTSYVNTGAYNQAKLSGLNEALEIALGITPDASEETIDDVFNNLKEVYNGVIINGKNIGGLNKDITDCEKDMTVEKLHQASGFSRASSYTRFGKPLHWTVENFRIPDGGNGTKQGLDSYSGREALMLGVWNDREKNLDGDLSDARIYQRVTLSPGIYFFGAAYNTTYNITRDAYMFVSDRLLSTSDIPNEATAFYPIADCGENINDYYGLWFSIDDEKEVIIGWQADLAGGSPTQEFRAEKVALLKLHDITASGLTSLVDEIDLLTSLLRENNHLNHNTGYFTADAVSEIEEARDEALTLSDNPSRNELEDAYYNLLYKWNLFLDSRNPLATPDLASAADITVEKLIESTDFTPTDPGVTTRFASPKYWTVENFSIPNGSDGTKDGLDKYSGKYSLMLGIWGDRNSNTSGQLSDARIYRKIHLEAGEYFFGATYNAIFNLYNAYMWVSPVLTTTDNIPEKAISYSPVSDFRIGAEMTGLNFTIETPGEYYVGWQADLSNGGGEQEFRAENIMLLDYSHNSSVKEITDTFDDGPVEYYNLTGIRLNVEPDHGFYIIRRGSKSIKVIR